MNQYNALIIFAKILLNWLEWLQSWASKIWPTLAFHSVRKMWCSTSFSPLEVCHALCVWTDGILWKKHFEGHHRSRPAPGPEPAVETLQGNPGRPRLHSPAGGDPFPFEILLVKQLQLIFLSFFSSSLPVTFRVWFTETWSPSTSSSTPTTTWRSETSAWPRTTPLMWYVSAFLRLTGRCRSRAYRDSDCLPGCR